MIYLFLIFFCAVNAARFTVTRTHKRFRNEEQAIEVNRSIRNPNCGSTNYDWVIDYRVVYIFYVYWIFLAQIFRLIWSNVIKYKHHSGHIECLILIEEFDTICLTNFFFFFFFFHWLHFGCVSVCNEKWKSDKWTNRKMCENKMEYERTYFRVRVRDIIELQYYMSTEPRLSTSNVRMGVENVISLYCKLNEVNAHEVLP